MIAAIIILIIAIVVVGVMALSGRAAKHEANRPPNSDDADEHFNQTQQK